MTTLITLVATLSTAQAQDLTLPALSPRAEVMQRVGVLELRVNYASPAKRDRAVWGELVPYGELWRTGANRATTFETNGTVSIGGSEVPAGKYAMFTIPGEQTWTVILNSDSAQGGTGSYDEKLDVARLEVTPQAGGARERLTFLFSDTADDGTRLDLVWDGVRVEVPIQLDTDSQVTANVEAFTSGAEGQLTQAARHYARAENYGKALDLVQTAIDIEENWFNVWIQADILKQSGDRRKALRAARRAKVLGDQAENFFWKDRVETALKEWRRG